jgi:hypothetical protein
MPMKKSKRRVKRQVFAEFVKHQLEMAETEQDTVATTLDCKPSTFRGYLYRNAFPQHVGIALYLRYASKGMTPEAYLAKPQDKRVALTQGLIKRIESSFRINWCVEKKQHRQSQPELPSTLFDAFASLDKLRGKSDEMLKSLGNHALSLMSSLQLGDFVVFVGSDAVPSLSAQDRAAWIQAIAQALQRNAYILFVQPASVVSVKVNGTFSKTGARNLVQEFRTLRNQLLAHTSDATVIDAHLEQYLIASTPYYLPGFAFTVFGTMRSDDEQTVLRCCIRLPGDRLGNNLLYPSYAPLLKQLESTIYQTILSQAKVLARDGKAAKGKRKQRLLTRLNLNQDLVRIFEGYPAWH